MRHAWWLLLCFLKVSLHFNKLPESLKCHARNLNFGNICMYPLYMYVHTEYNVGSILKLSRHINSDFSRRLIARLSVIILYLRNKLKFSWALRHGSSMSYLKFLLSNTRTIGSMKIKHEYQIEFMDLKRPRPLSMSPDVTAATSAQKRKSWFPQY